MQLPVVRICIDALFGVRLQHGFLTLRVSKGIITFLLATSHAIVAPKKVMTCNKVKMDTVCLDVPRRRVDHALSINKSFTTSMLNKLEAMLSTIATRL